MSTDYKFEGWIGHDTQSGDGKMVWEEFQPKRWEETDIDIKVTHSGVCATDLATLRSAWGPTQYPICIGHEIVGEVVRVGSKARADIKLGDRVGMSPQSDACLNRFPDKPHCEGCERHLPQYCHTFIQTYGSNHFNGDKAMGGYATYHRCPSTFAVKIPDGLDSADVAPALCAGITVFSPLKHNSIGPGKSVGVVGVGGLGHFAIMFARAMGADRVVGISRNPDKRDEVLRMGAHDYIATAGDKAWSSKHDREFDVVINTTSTSKIPLMEHLVLLGLEGTYIQLGLPDDGDLVLNPYMLLARRLKITGSGIGSPEDMQDMLALMVSKNIKPWVQKRPMSEANQVMLDLDAGKARYRYVLENPQ